MKSIQYVAGQDVNRRRLWHKPLQVCKKSMNCDVILLVVMIRVAGKKKNADLRHFTP